MKIRKLTFALVIVLALLGTVVSARAQSRPRRVKPPPPDTLLGPEPKPSPQTDKNAPLLDVKPATPVGAAPVSADTTHAFQLLQQKQYADAAKEAKQIAVADPGNSEAWKIAGFAEFYLKQFSDASEDLQRALDLQRKANQEDAHTVDALAESYLLGEKFDRALPLLVSITSRTGAAPDPLFLYYRGVAELKTSKPVDAEKSFSAAVKANPKDGTSLFYLGQIALARNQLDVGIGYLNRATLADPKRASSWALLTSAYLRRATLTEDPAKADADYLSAVRAGDTLTQLRTDEDALRLYAQALIGSKQYLKAAATLERTTAGTSGITLYLLGFSYSRAANFPKAISALERANAKDAANLDVYRELGYDYEKTKQYAKAFDVYQRALKVSPDEQDLKESLERVRPFAKQ